MSSKNQRPNDISRRRRGRKPTEPGAETTWGRAVGGSHEAHDWTLRLYVAGRSPKSELARANLQRLCEEYIPGRYTIEIVDLLSSPHLARADQIVAIPTLIRKLPTPVKRIIGDLSNTERAMVALDLAPVPQ